MVCSICEFVTHSAIIEAFVRLRQSALSCWSIVQKCDTQSGGHAYFGTNWDERDNWFFLGWLLPFLLGLIRKEILARKDATCTTLCDDDVLSSWCEQVISIARYWELIGFSVADAQIRMTSVRVYGAITCELKWKTWGHELISHAPERIGVALVSSDLRVGHSREKQDPNRRSEYSNYEETVWSEGTQWAVLQQKRACPLRAVMQRVSPHLVARIQFRCTLRLVPESHSKALRAHELSPWRNQGFGDRVSASLVAQ